VAGGWADPSKTWPHIFAVPDDGSAVPSKSADMSQFTWEAPSEQTAAAELEALMHGATVTIPTEPDPAAGMAPPPFPLLPDGLQPGGPRPVPADAGALEWS
jgi:hypothetical protein